MQDVATLADPARAGLVMHPLRRRILEEAASGAVSSTEIARRTGESRQKVNYHVRALAGAGLLEAAGERPRRGLIEKLYRASARAYTVSPDVLGTLVPTAEQFHDAYSAGALMALASRAHAEVARSNEQATARGRRLATLSIQADVRFSSARQQSAFAEALTQAVTDVVARFSEPASGAHGRPYRLVVGAYPPPTRDPGSEP